MTLKKRKAYVGILFVVFVMSVINSFKCYREAYLLGGRYPDDSIYMLQHFMNNNFESLNYQRLSVASILVFLVIFTQVIILFILKYRAEREVEAQTVRCFAFGWHSSGFELLFHPREILLIASGCLFQWL